MCYDMSFFSNIRQVGEVLSLPPEEDLPFPPTWHQVAQSFPSWPVLVQEDGRLRVKLFEWGLIADYMNTPDKIREYRTSMANARSEKMRDDRRSVWFRLRQQRCIVPTTGFFEHRDTGAKKKLPYFIRGRQEPVLLLAGLWNYAPLPDPETGELKGTFAVITRPANELLAKIHNAGPNAHRMPLILTPEKASAWLEPGLTEESLHDLLDFCYPATDLEAWPVNTIRTRKADTPAVIAPLDAGLVPPL